MPSQLLVNQEFLADDLDISVGDVNHSLVDTPNFCLPCATKIILRNAATHPNHASAVQTSIPSDIAGFFHNSSAQNYDRGTSVDHSGIGATSNSSEFTPFSGYQWQMPQPSLDIVPLLMPLPIAAPHSLLYCGWTSLGVPCPFNGTLQELKAHCMASHFAGPKDTLIVCQWKNCRYYKRGDHAVNLMRRDSIWRHTCEKHLFLKRGT